MPTEEEQQHRRISWHRQWVGVIAGGILGFALGALFPTLVEKYSTFSVVIWCAVLGGVLTSLDGFISAGAALTRSENRWVNLVVGLGIPIILLIIFGLVLSSRQR